MFSRCETNAGAESIDYYVVLETKIHSGVRYAGFDIRIPEADIESERGLLSRIHLALAQPLVLEDVGTGGPPGASSPMVKDLSP
jgi:hypothetical protein